MLDRLDRQAVMYFFFLKKQLFWFAAEAFEENYVFKVALCPSAFTFYILCRVYLPNRPWWKSTSTCRVFSYVCEDK